MTDYKSEEWIWNIAEMEYCRNEYYIHVDAKRVDNANTKQNVWFLQQVSPGTKGLNCTEVRTTRLCHV
jgi:hypothetical protein